jgi:hypothetical protein
MVLFELCFVAAWCIFLPPYVEIRVYNVCFQQKNERVEDCPPDGNEGDADDDSFNGLDEYLDGIEVVT